MKETLLIYGPAIVVAALALILRRRKTKKKTNELRDLHVVVKSKGEKTGRQILETFWEEDR